MAETTVLDKPVMNEDITLTEKAARQVFKVKAENNIPESHGLRLGVKGGGCSGLSYVLGFDEKAKENDKVLNIHGGTVFVDPKSLFYLSGTVPTDSPAGPTPAWRRQREVPSLWTHAGGAFRSRYHMSDPRLSPPLEARPSDLLKTIGQLRSTHLFDALPEESLGRLAAACRQTTPDAGALLMRQGEAGDCVYVVVDGRLTVVARNEDGTDVLLGRSASLTAMETETSFISIS